MTDGVNEEKPVTAVYSNIFLFTIKASQEKATEGDMNTDKSSQTALINLNIYITAVSRKNLQTQLLFQQGRKVKVFRQHRKISTFSRATH